MYPSLLVGLALAVGAPALKPRRTESIVGEWVAETVLHNGRPDLHPGVLRYTFTDDRAWVLTRDGRRLDGGGRGYTLDLKADPPAVEFTLHRARPDSDRLLGIFRLEGDTLTLCLAMQGKPRPTRFESPPDSEISLVVFRRARPSR